MSNDWEPFLTTDPRGKDNRRIVAGYFMDFDAALKFVEANGIRDKVGNPLTTWAPRFSTEVDAEEPDRVGPAEVKRLENNTINFATRINTWIRQREEYPYSIIDGPLDRLEVALTCVSRFHLKAAHHPMVGGICGEAMQVPELKKGHWYLFFMGRKSYTHCMLYKPSGFDIGQHKNALRDALARIGVDAASLQWACIFDPDPYGMPMFPLDDIPTDMELEIVGTFMG